MVSILINSLQWVWSKIYDDCHENYKGLTRNRRWLLMRKIGQFKTVRSIISWFMKRSCKSYIITSNDCYLFNDVNVDEVVESLNKNGFYLGINLPQDIVQEILKFAIHTTCYGNRKPEFGFYYADKEQAQAKYGKHFIVGSYFNTALLCPAIKKLESEPKLLEIAAKYLDSKPLHQANQLWWSFAGESTPHERRRAAQMFHYDQDDYRFLKFFFYLTDVDLSSGPHVCIRGSHEKKKLSHKFLRGRYNDKEIIDYYGTDSIVTICGKAGFGFAEDTFCFHKGNSPTHRDRLLLHIEFALNDYGMQNDLLSVPAQSASQLDRVRLNVRL